MDPLQFNSTMAITSTIGRFSRKKNYQELGFEYLQQKQW